LYAAQRSRRSRALFLLIIASFLLAACGVATENQNWPGISANDDVVYLAYGPQVLAIDVAARELLWSFPDESRPGLFFYAPPSVDDASVVLGDFGVSGGFFSPGTTVTVYSLRQGASGAPPTVAWSRDDLASDRIVAGALQAEGMVFVGTSDNQLLALDAEIGDLIWSYETEHSVWAEPVYADGVLYVVSLDNYVYALDAGSGDLLWRAEMGGSIASRPVLADGRLYVSSFDRAVHVLDVSSGEQLWQADADTWVWGAPALSEDAVFFGDLDGHIFAVERDNGSPRWEAQVQGAIQSAPLYVDGRLFVGAGDVSGDDDERAGRVAAFDAESGEQLWQQAAPAPVFTGPVQAGNSVVVAVMDGTQLRLLVFNMESGAQEWSFSPPSE
jgi:outer membrane protein assembly factor BamB